MNKKNKWLLTMACACVALVSMAGCELKLPFGDDPAPQIELNLVEESVEMELFEELDLEYTYTGERTLVWSVADPSIVTVANGKLVALKEGETTVTVQGGDVSDVCSVKVSGFKKGLLNVAVEKAQTSLYVGESDIIKPMVTYGTKVIEDATFTYESFDTAVASVSQAGVLTANSVGTTSVSVTANVLQTMVGCIVNVTVEKSGAISVDTIQAELYVLPEYDGKTYKNEMQIQATVTEKGVAVQSAPLKMSWTSSDTSVATVENGKVVAVGLGNAEIKVTYVGSDGYSVEAVSFITVLPVTHAIEMTTNVIKTDLFTMEGFETEGMSAYITDGTLNIPVPVSNDALDFSKIDVYGETTLVLDTGKILVNMPIYVWTDIISNMADFTALRTKQDGHYRLETDLDFTGVTWTYETPIIFKGVLDGGNHTLTNFAPNGCGLFYELGGESKIQNLNFRNAIIKADNNSIGCLASIVSSGAIVTVKNVTGNIVNNGNACGGLFGRVGANSEVTLKNNELHIYTSNTASSNGALVGCSDSAFVMPSDATSVIYTNFKLCGNTAYSGFTNSASTTINDYESVKPTAYEEVLDKWNDLVGTKISILETDVAKATLFGKTVEEIEFNNGFTLTQERLDGFTGNNFELMIEKTNGQTAYYAIKLEYGDLKLTNANKHLLKRAESGNIILQEDIDLSGETWMSTVVFTGTLDGNGYAIKNMTVSANSNENGYQGLFKYLGEGALIKNVAFTNVVLGANSGVIAGQILGSSKAKAENLFIQVTKTGNSTTTARYGIVERTNNGSLDLTNVVVKMPGRSQNETLLGFNTKARCTLNNVYGISISPTNKIAQGTSTVPAQHNCGMYSTVDEFNAANKTLTDFLTTCVEKYLTNN